MECVNSVNVYPSKVTLQTGSWYYGAWAEVCPVDAEIVWHSDNTSVASVNEASGYIYANSPGTARIYAEATDGSGISDYLTVTVSGKVSVQTVTLNRTRLSIEKGSSAVISATVYPTNATNKTINWRSANTNIATVSNGRITAKAKGSTYIYAEAADGSGAYGRCYVSVTEDVLVESVYIDPYELTMTAGESAYVYATVCPPDADNQCLTWESSDWCVAEVNPDSGFVYARNEGEATITATACDGSGVYGECVITVEPPIPVEGIGVSPTSLTMNVGDTQKLSATICPSDATNKMVTWRSSDENVATVELRTGLVTAKRAGSATITATTADGGYTAKCVVSVSQILTYPDTLITNTPTQKAIIQLKNMRDETVVAYLRGTISCDAMEIATRRIDYEISLVRADYIAVGTNPFSEYAYATLGGDSTAIVPYSFNRDLYYRENNPFTGLDVMVVQRVLELYGYYEHDPKSLYGTWDQATQDAALSWKPLLTPVNGQRVFDCESFNVLFQVDNISKRTYEAMKLLQQFNLQHKQVQIQCRDSLLLSGEEARIEMPVKGSSMSGGTGRADIVCKTIGGTYVWEVKHNSPSAIAVGDAQIQRYISASQGVYDQPSFYPIDKSSPYTLPLIAGPSVFSPTAIPWFDKYLLYRSYASINPYENALVVYEESDTVPNGYAYAPVPVEVKVPVPEASYVFDLSGVYDVVTNYGHATVKSLQIDPQTGEMLVQVFALGVICCFAMSVVAFAW